MAELISVVKERSVISFEIINGDRGNIASYDIANGNCVVDGRKLKSLQNYFSQINRPYSKAIDEVLYKTKNETKEFFEWMAGKFSACTNFNTLLQRMSDCSREEEWFSFCKENTIRYGIPKNDLKEFNKPEKKRLKESNDYWSACCRRNKNENEERELFDKLNDKYKIIITSDYCYDPVEQCNRYMYKPKLNYSNDYSKFKRIHECFNLDILAEKIEYYKLFEGLDQEEIIDNLLDYNDMVKQMNRNTTKYPQNLITTHKIIEKSYKIWVKDFPDEAFLDCMDVKLNYIQQVKYKKEKDEKDEKEGKITYKTKYKDGKYQIITPLSANDIKIEGVNNHNCVACYIPRILKKETAIYFGRLVSSPDESLLTIEVKDKTVTQAYSSGNRRLNQEQKEFIHEWAKAKGLKVTVHYFN